MQPFEHFTPGTLPEALEILSRENGAARIIAGGTDLVLQMRNGGIAPKKIVNIKRLQALKGIHFDEQEGATIGALTTLRELHRSPEIQVHYPALSFAASRMASEQIRAFATMGGNLCNGSPSADTAPPLIALKAEARIISLESERKLPLEDFFLEPGKTALRAGELLKEIHVPPPEGRAVFLKHIPRAFMDISIVCVAIRLLLEGDLCREARIVLGAVAPTPMRARQSEKELAGQHLTGRLISRVGNTAASESRPIDDAKGSAWYRKRMVEVLVRRGLERFTQEASAS